jgi:translocation and assembly module TamB
LKSRSQQLILSLAAALIIFFLVGSFWIFGTTAGARWLMKEVSLRTNVKIDAGTVEGRLINNLRLDQVRVVWREGNLTIKNFHVRWKPLMLINGAVSIDEIAFKGVEINDNRPEDKKPPDLTWPKAPGILRVFDAYVTVFRIEGLEYRRSGGETEKVGKVFSSLAWSRGMLATKDLVIELPSGRIQGKVSLGLPHPFLAADLSSLTRKPIAGMDRIVITARLKKNHSDADMAGKLKIDGFEGTKKKIEFTSELEVGKDSVRLVTLKLREHQRRGSVTGDGTVTFPYGEPLFLLKLSLSGLDFSPELRLSTDLSGTIAFEGGSDGYQGSFDLENSSASWQALRLSGSFKGDSGGLDMTGLKGHWLKGELEGAVKVGWGSGLSSSFELRGRKLDPSVVTPEWDGVINFDMGGETRLSSAAPAHAEVDIRLLQSRLRGKSLDGAVRARLDGEELDVSRLLFRGKGFDINASGKLTKRISFFARVSDLSGLIPGAKGKASAEGWIRRFDRRLTGSIAGNGKGLSLNGTSIGSIDYSAVAQDTEGYRVKAAVEAHALKTAHLGADSFALDITGGIEDHTIVLSLSSGNSELNVSMIGSYLSGAWKGRIMHVSDKGPSGLLTLKEPAAFDVSSDGLGISTFSLAGDKGESLTLRVKLSKNPLTGFFGAEWKRLSLSRFGQWVNNLSLEGQSSGTMHVNWLKDERMKIALSMSASAKCTFEGRECSTKKTSLRINWNDSGLSALAEFDIEEGGRLSILAASVERAKLKMPERLDVETSWKGFNLLFFKTWLPPALGTEGKISGGLRGSILSGGRLDLEGNAAVSEGALSYASGKKLLRASVRTAGLHISWRHKAIKGEFELTLEDYGTVKGSFQIPLTASLPLTLDRKGAVNASLVSQVRENGILSALMPGLIQESRGELGLNLSVRGTWKNPNFSGKIRLGDASAYLPETGARLKNLVLDGHLNDEKVIVDSLRVDSEKGSIEGKGVLTLRDWKIADYKGTVAGKDFQAVYLPELQVLISPDLTFEGMSGRLTLRGKILIPEALILGQGKESPVRSSNDLIIVGRAETPAKKLPVALDMQMDISLGENVRVRAAGLDGQIKGRLQLTAASLDQIKGLGEFRIEKGKFARYGVNLDVEKGRFIFSGGNVENPALDVLALRTVGDVRAGIEVIGTLRSPLVRLYSQPSMPDADVLGYIVLGHPFSQNKEETTLMTRAAGLLLSSGSGPGLQEQIKNRLGLDTLDIESGEGTAGAGETGGIARSLVTVGKYLTPKLYVSYGRSLLGDSQLFRMRYTLSKHWEVQTQSGAQNGADIFYKIDFR